jgi:hypothetical protein
MVRASPVPNRENNPAADHQGVQYDAHGEDRLHPGSTGRRRTAPDDPGLIDQGPDGDEEKERLKTLEDK